MIAYNSDAQQFCTYIYIHVNLHTYTVIVKIHHVCDRDIHKLMQHIVLTH